MAAWQGKSQKCVSLQWLVACSDILQSCWLLDFFSQMKVISYRKTWEILLKLEDMKIFIIIETKIIPFENVQKRKQTARIQVLRWWEIIYLNCWLRNVRLSLQYLKDCVNKNLIDGFCGDTSKEWQWSEGWKNSEASWSVYQNMNNLSSNLSMTFDFFTDIDGRHYWLFASPFFTSSTNDPNPIRTSKTIDLDWGFDSERASTYLEGHWDSYATHR